MFSISTIFWNGNSLYDSIPQKWKESCFFLQNSKTFLMNTKDNLFGKMQKSLFGRSWEKIFSLYSPKHFKIFSNWWEIKFFFWASNHIDIDGSCSFITKIVSMEYTLLLNIVQPGQWRGSFSKLFLWFIQK